MQRQAETIGKRWDYCADSYYAQGRKAFLEKDYISAANYFEAALIYDETNDEAACW